MANDILTERFRARDGLLYTIHEHETGLGAYRPDLSREEMRTPEAIDAAHQALREWCEKVATLGEPAP